MIIKMAASSQSIRRLWHMMFLDRAFKDTSKGPKGAVTLLQILENLQILKNLLLLHGYWIWEDVAYHHKYQLVSLSTASIGEKWVNRFVKRHDELSAKYTRKYDYQRAKCEDPELIKDWFERVRDTIQKYGIIEQDIYNMDETGFQMGIISTAKALQPGNREWVTAIEAINTG
ncbi:conserved hypothetical protein [Talaromyces stipitatus ATCC 10500]|uniref:HTH CENPB-type domain-containing protein n=1 Tax=Talaromyces stipitatus (strain ATCC 10500 / CBS 375.48 / QM 6759 / NRRL 1006) TaxID=441959 RepID=B8MQD9_TALSN|nr:uncharacterized protein TSTA_058300 [Talaromyces stipitatus ATCC 10500]EED13341.1 conserved hypothetical protein [Talaromyces stipitatus ATCC 10500]